MTMQIIKQSTKFIRPATETPPALHQYKLGFIDEHAPAFNINVVLFYSITTNDNDNPDLIVSRLENSLEKPLTRFYPLAGRYNEDTHVVECEDQGVEFIRAKVSNIKFEDIILGSEVNLKLVDEFVPAAIGALDQVTDPLLSIQVTMFEDGDGLALGVSISHRVADTSTLCTFLNEWAAISRGGENLVDFPTGPGFNSASFFPPRGIPPSLKGLLPRTKSIDNMLRSNYVTKKLSFTETEISNLRDKIIGSREYCSKVQLVSALIWKALIDIDHHHHHHHPPRPCIFLLPVNLRGKTASAMPKESCGNLSMALLAESKAEHTTTEALLLVIRNCVNNFLDYYAKIRDDHEQVQTMVLNSFSQRESVPRTTTVISLTSWCKFPFYQLDFGFGKPKWVNRGRVLGKNTGYLMDGVGGNGIEAYVGIEHTDVPYFEQAIDIKKAFAA